MRSLPRSFRQIFAGSQCLLEELEMVGRTRVTEARVPGLKGHVHSGVFEIFLIERGEVRWWVEGESHTLAAGDVYLNRPGELHGSIGPSLAPCAYCWIQLNVSGKSFPALTQTETRRIVQALSSPGHRRIGAPEAVREHFVKLWEVHAWPAPDSRLRARAHLHLLLAELVAQIESDSAKPSPVSFAIGKVVRTIESSPGHPHSVASLAGIAKLGLTQFNERFLAEMGLTPSDFVRRTRIARAKDRLQAGEQVTAVAADLGFSSSQHFATTFKKLEGITPTQFRASHHEA